MEKNNMKMLTEGSPLKLLVGFIVPLLLGFLFQQLYSMIDTIVVGKYLGVDALAGVGSTGALNFLVLGFCMGICSGFALPVAQKFGSQDLDGLRRIVGNILWLGIAFAAVITLVITALCDPMLRMTKTPEETFAYAHTYILIIFIGIPATMLYNLLSGIIRSLGDSRTPLYFLVFSSLLNIALDLILILWAKWGVAGAAAATVVSQLVSGILCLAYMAKRYPVLHLSRDDLKLRKKECSALLSMGIPMGLQYSITAIGSTILQTAVNSLGPAAMAATTAAGRVYGLLACPLDAIGTASATFTGQNVGAGKLRRVHTGARANFIIGMVYSLLALGMVILWAEPVIMMFLDPRETQVAQIIRLSRQFLICNVAMFGFLLCVNLFRFAIQGMGFSNFAVIAGVLELVARGLVASLLVPRFGFDAVCFANPAAWFLADLFLIPMYFLGLRMLSRRNAETPAA